MSISYSVDITLNAKYNRENIYKIYDYGRSCGLIFYKDMLDKNSIINNFNDFYYIITEHESGERHIFTRYNDTNFLLFFFKSDEEYLIFSISLFGNIWKIELDDMLYVDLSKYINLLLKVCQDFTILSIEAGSDAL